MLFNSVQFLVFFTVVAGVYFFLPRRGKLVFLLLASYWFYMSWKVEYALLIVISTLVDYWVALGLFRADSRAKKRWLLVLSLFTNLGILFTFKYFNFISASFQDLVNLFDASYQSPVLKVLLPVGISFYTFQTLSYTIDVYRGDREPERNLLVFALYVSFFPQLVAGPIERSTHLLPQFHTDKRFEWSRLTSGFALVLWGYFLKLVIADQLGPYVDEVFGSPRGYSGGHFLLASYFFAFQIFGDFAGYSCIAIGVARMLGYDLMENFRRPYFSRSVREFWTRWHISLSSWFRDYLYIPLGGNRRRQARNLLNVMLVFVISGLWHGANWTFVAWGALHGAYLVAGRWLTPPGARDGKRSGLMNLVNVFITFNLVVFAWIFFRAESLSDAWYIVTHLADFPAINAGYLANVVLPFTNDYSSISMFASCLFFIGVMEAVHGLQEHGNNSLTRLWARSGLFRAACLVVLLNVILLFGNFDSNSFIYFQF
ncbi:MBOAT family protein [Marinihelvus fidelis]|uniref:Probable alginate O-acetylase n=1 Tax=Marinihelvus fidelis TaxID=2613842 RepID=A0A5N0TG00_9GAMM|nr:MBOAT family O-acyltransferase [Marinihelvus fidelis]KAA9134083.1 MBOAT family protein [Marinihelvus fidelis]